MGCLISKNGQVRTISDEVEEPLPASAFSTRGAANAWLQEIGLPQYAVAFEDAGFSDWDLLACLTEADLEAITAHTGTVIPPGHRKKLLMASRQMGQSSQQVLAGVPPFGSARRYSHGSNPGNGSRGGGLAAATSLERRSYGRRPLSSSSRNPSLCNPANGHHQHHLYHGPHNATDDGTVSGRRSRVMVPSRNSSRNSLSGATGGGGGAAMVGHTIGYIASPSMTGGDTMTATSGLDRPFLRSAAAAGPGGLDSVVDFWVPSEVRLSAVEPSSPRTPAAAAVAAAAAAVAAGVVSTPQRRRRRWSMKKCASRGALISGGGTGAVAPSVVGRVVGIEVASGSSMGWMDAEAAGGGAIRTRVDSPDDVRQISVTSSVGPSEAVALGGPVSSARQVSSRDLQFLVVGAAGGDGTPLRNQTFRSPSLAARPDKPYNVMPAPLPMSPPRSSAGLSGPIVAVAPSSVALAAGPSSTMLTTPHLLEPQPHPQPHPYQHQHAQPQQQPLPQQQQQRIHSARDGGPGLAGVFGANSNAVISPPSGGFGRGASAPVSAGCRPSTANNDSTLKDWGAARPESPSPPTPSAAPAGTNHMSYAARPRSGCAAGNGGAPASTQPSVAWGSHFDAAGRTTVLRSQDAVEVDDAPSGDGQGQGNPNSALPRFVRAFAGWALPAGGGGGGGGNTSASRASNQKHPQLADKTHQLASAPQIVAAHAAGPNRTRAVQLASEAGTEKNAPPPQEAVVGRGVDTVETSRAKSARQQLVPDMSSHVGVWDQNAALCIKGRGYKPTAAARVSAAVDEADGGSCMPLGVRPASAASNGSGGGGGNSIAAAAAAARGGGWPFVMPQLPLPTRMSVNEAPAAAGSAPGAVVVFGVAIGGSKAGGGGGRGSVRQVAISAPAQGHLFGPSAVTADSQGAFSSPSAAAASVPAAMPFVVHWDARDGGAAAAAAAAAAGGDGSNPSLLLESTSDWSARRALLQHSSRPHDWKNSGGGGGNPDAGPYRRATITTTAAAAAHWPAMPLQPPTRAKPATVYGISPVAHGFGAAPMGAAVMEVLTPDAPGPSRPPRPPPADGGGGGGAGASTAAAAVHSPVGPPRPTPGRQLDLEMLADQVDRIMTHLACITHDDHAGGGSEGSGGEADGKAGGGGGGGGGGSGGRAAAVDGLRSSLRPGPRMQAIDQKRQELQALHRDLVTRVAALASQPAQLQQPHSEQPPPPPPRQPRGGSTSTRGATAGEGDAAMDALAEVEARIRAKLAELAEMTMGPGRGSAAARSGVPPAAAAAAAPGVRKRAMRSDDAASGEAAGGAGGIRDGGGEDGTAGGRRRWEAEAALHAGVLEVLGARKRQVQGGWRSSNSDGGAESGAEGPLPEGLGAAVNDVASRAGAAASLGPIAAAVAASSGGGGRRVLDGGERGGAVLAETHEALKAEILAIDSKIKARVRAPGAAVARRV